MRCKNILGETFSNRLIVCVNLAPLAKVEKIRSIVYYVLSRSNLLRPITQEVSSSFSENSKNTERFCKKNMLMHLNSHLATSKSLDRKEQMFFRTLALFSKLVALSRNTRIKLACLCLFLHTLLRVAHYIN